MTTRHARGDDFSRLVYQILVVERRRSIRDVAAAIGMEYSAFHARVIGRTHFKATELGRLIREVPDPRLCDQILEQTGFIAALRSPTSTGPDQPPMQAALLVAQHVLGLIQAIGADGADTSDRVPDKALSDRMRELERSVATLASSVHGGRPRTVVLLGAGSTASQASEQRNAAQVYMHAQQRAEGRH